MAGEIYLEIMPVDKALRVTAIDSETGVEVVFAAPSYTARERIDSLARRKLEARIAREGRSGQKTDDGSQAPKKERGKLI